MVNNPLIKNLCSYDINCACLIFYICYVHKRVLQRSSKDYYRMCVCVFVFPHHLCEVRERNYSP